MSALITYGYGYDLVDRGSMPNGTSGNGENAVRAFRNNWNFDERVHIVDAETVYLEIMLITQNGEILLKRN